VQVINSIKLFSCRHAGVYTEEEVVAQAKESMARLQNLYVREFRSLQFKLREQRRHYLAAVKKEKETMSEYLCVFFIGYSQMMRKRHAIGRSGGFLTELL
jgi:hypothetical protein